MLQSLVITLREGVEAALVLGIVLTYLTKIGRRELHAIVYYALGAALAGSLVAAFALAKADVNPELFEGWVMLIAALFVITMIVFMARAAKTLKGDIEGQVGGFATRGSRFGLFLFVFFMVLREGVETVLILSAVQLTTDAVLGFIGTLIGIALSVVFAVMFVRGSLRINLAKFFRVTTIILVFVAFQLIVSGLHEFSEVGLIPSSKRQMALIGPIVRNEIFFFVIIVALAALMVLFESRHRAPAADAASKADQRKAQWSDRRERLWSASVYVSSFVFIFLVTAQFIYAKSTTALSPATPVDFINGRAQIATAALKPGDLERFSAVIEGEPVNFLIYKKPDGKLATIMDACAICGPVGFYNSGAQGITCKNCNAPVNPDTVGDSGGCNPIPLKSIQEGGNIIVTLADLQHGASQVHE